jgi:hypothetical protein
MHAIRGLLRDRGIVESTPDFESFWNDLQTYVECEHAHGSSIEEILSPVTAALTYDIPAWQEAGNPKNPSGFRHHEIRNYCFQLGPKAAKELQAALQVWGVSVKGLTKGVTRIRAEWQVRDSRVVATWLESATG